MQGGHNGAVNEGKLQLLEFLRGLSYKGRHLLINPNRLLTLQQLQSAVLRADRFLDEVDEEVGGDSDLAITGAATAPKQGGMVSILCLQPSVLSRLACAAALPQLTLQHHVPLVLLIRSSLQDAQCAPYQHT